MFFTENPQRNKQKQNPNQKPQVGCIVVLQPLSHWLIFLKYFEILGSNAK